MVVMTVFFNTHIRKSVLGLSDVMAACRSPKPFVGVRVPRGMPINLMYQQVCEFDYYQTLNIYETFFS